MKLPVEISAAGTVTADPRQLSAYLSDLRNHWQLTGRWVHLDELTGPGRGPTGGVVLLRGPLGLSRRVHTRVLEGSGDTEIQGQARIGEHTRAVVRWVIEPLAGKRSRVTLQASVLEAGWLDRVLLALGGRRWLTGRFRETIAQLGERVAAPAPTDPRSSVVV
ncbi:MAG TPA: SRPBCC family protein [Solirubrobacteraceae bacterium]|nr:SRPBCC family protein [Solirubrobacteraceae bacterium]